MSDVGASVSRGAQLHVPDKNGILEIISRGAASALEKLAKSDNFWEKVDSDVVNAMIIRSYGYILIEKGKIGLFGMVTEETILKLIKDGNYSTLKKLANSNEFWKDISDNVINAAVIKGYLDLFIDERKTDLFERVTKDTISEILSSRGHENTLRGLAKYRFFWESLDQSTVESMLYCGYIYLFIDNKKTNLITESNVSVALRNPTSVQLIIDNGLAHLLTEAAFMGTLKLGIDCRQSLDLMVEHGYISMVLSIIEKWPYDLRFSEEPRDALFGAWIEERKLSPEKILTFYHARAKRSQVAEEDQGSFNIFKKLCGDMRYIYFRCVIKLVNRIKNTEGYNDEWVESMILDFLRDLSGDNKDSIDHLMDKVADVDKTVERVRNELEEGESAKVTAFELVTAASRLEAEGLLRGDTEMCPICMNSYCSGNMNAEIVIHTCNNSFHSGCDENCREVINFCAVCRLE